MWVSWPSSYQIIGDALICKLDLLDAPEGVILLNTDQRKQNQLPDCYSGTVTEVGARCKLVKPGDRIVFTRWIYSQSDVDDEHLCLREVDLVVVNDRCVNDFVAVKLYEPFKKTETLIQVERRKPAPKYYYGQVIDIDRSTKNKDTQDIKEEDIILFQHTDDYQYRIGRHTMVFKNMYDVVLLILEPVKELVA